MRLTLLEAEFLNVYWTPHGRIHRPVSKFKDADGIQFLCPRCFAANGGRHGTHLITCWFKNRPNVSPNDFPNLVRWEARCMGESFETLSLFPLIEFKTGCFWYGSIREGEAESY